MNLTPIEWTDWSVHVTEPDRTTYQTFMTAGALMSYNARLVWRGRAIHSVADLAARVAAERKQDDD